MRRYEGGGERYEGRRETNEDFRREWEGERGFRGFQNWAGRDGARLVFGERLEIHILDLFYENGLLDIKLYVGARRLVRWNN